MQREKHASEDWIWTDLRGGRESTQGWKYSGVAGTEVIVAAVQVDKCRNWPKEIQI